MNLHDVIDKTPADLFWAHSAGAHREANLALRVNNAMYCECDQRACRYPNPLHYFQWTTADENNSCPYCTRGNHPIPPPGVPLRP